MKALLATSVAVLAIFVVWRACAAERAQAQPERFERSASAERADGAGALTPPAVSELAQGSELAPDRRAIEASEHVSPPRPTTVVLHGSVRHAGGATLATPVDVLVALQLGPTVESDALSRATTRTDEAGRFAVDVPAPNVDVYVTARVRSRDLYSWRHQPVLLPVGAAPEALQLVVGPLDATLTGLVSTRDGVPIEGAAVRSAHHLARTNDAGRYSLRVNSATCERATASAPGFSARTRMVAKLEQGNEHTLDFTLQSGLSVRGTVRDGDSTPIVGASLRLSWDDGHEPVTATSDGDGVYTLLDVARTPETPVTLTVRADGHVLHWTELTLPAEGDLQHDVRLLEGARVRGQVIDERGQPLSGAVVWIGLARHSIDCMQTVSDEAGRFELVGVGPGPTQLGVVHEGFAEQVEALEVSTDVHELPPVIVRLGRGRTMTGTVVDELGRPIAGVSIHARRKHSQGVLTRTAEDGTFTLELLPDVALVLSTTADGWQDFDVNVPAGPSGPLELRLQRAGRLHGRVIDAVSGAPLRVFTVRLVDPELRADERTAMGYRIHWEHEGVAFDADDGRWSTAGETLTPGVLGVEVRASGYEPLVVARALVVHGEGAGELVHALHPERR